MRKLLLILSVSSSLMLAGCSSSNDEKGAGVLTTVDGDKINLTELPKGVLEKKTLNGTLFGQNNANSFYGVWKNDADERGAVHYIGSEATKIPTAGSAVYRGDAVWISRQDGSLQKGGSTTLYVNFDRKLVDGAITFTSPDIQDDLRQNIQLHQTALRGAKFSGNATMPSLSGLPGYYNGVLAGKGASEMAGVVEFYDAYGLNSHSVAFGGQKQ